jgi:hypothetical protein
MTGACSLTYSIAGLETDDPETTASIAPRPVSPLAPELTEEDWRRAKAALGVAIDPQGPGTLVSWDNPENSRKGSFIPLGAPFVKNDEICRRFKANLKPSEKDLQGTACRPSGGDWTISSVAPFDLRADKATPKA